MIYLGMTIKNEKKYYCDKSQVYLHDVVDPMQDRDRDRGPVCSVDRDRGPECSVDRDRDTEWDTDNKTTSDRQTHRQGHGTERDRKISLKRHGGALRFFPTSFLHPTCLTPLIL